MSISINFSCSGCDAKAGRVYLAPPRFIPMFTTSDGAFGRYSAVKVEDAVPDGWIAFDPYTKCTYCPECWAEIEAPSAERGA